MEWVQALSLPFMQHAIVAVIFAGIAFPLIGVFVTSLNLVPLRFAMMHIALLGGAVGLFLDVDPLLMGLLFCGVSSLVLGPVSEKMRVGLGTLSGYLMTLTLALAFILFYKGNIHVVQAFSILWGNILSLTFWDLILVILVSVLILGLVILFYKEVQAILYDREVALAVGLPEKKLYYVVIFILGLSIAVSMRMIGALLIDAFVLLPSIAASLVSRSLKRMFIFSSIFGLISGTVGLYLSFLLDLPTSSAIILVASLIIGICTFLKGGGRFMGRRRRSETATVLIGGILILGLPFAAVAHDIVLASTSLSGAVARAAGAKEVRVLTPEGVTHPPEYELKPSDLMQMEGAAMVVYGGYERMVSRLLETSKKKNIVALQIDTVTSPENLVAQARRIAQALKTEKEEQAWEAGFLNRVNELRKRLGPFSGKRAAVHLQAQAFARWAGLSVVQMIRPGELTPRLIADTVAQRPDVIVDILHLPVARVIAENAKCKYVQVINFPGVEHTKTLDDIFEYNASRLRRAFQ